MKAIEIEGKKELKDINRGGQTEKEREKHSMRQHGRKRKKKKYAICQVFTFYVTNTRSYQISELLVTQLLNEQ